MHLSLDASPSFDPNRVYGVKEVFTWSCFEYPSYTPCFIPNKQDPTRVMLLVLPTMKRVTIDSGSLSPDAS